MNPSSQPTHATCQSYEILHIANDMEVFIFYADYLIDLLQKAYPKELKARLHNFMSEIEESMLTVAVKEQLILALQEIYTLLLKPLSETNLHEIELRLRSLRAFMQLNLEVL